MPQLNKYEDRLIDLAAKHDVRVMVVAQKQDVYERFARDVTDLIAHNNDAGKSTTLILPVGPVKQYPLLANICNRERISWKQVYTFNMDEYLDWQGRMIPDSHPLSFKAFMIQRFFALLDDEQRIPEENVYFPDPLNIEAFSDRIAELGGIDCCYGGVGVHGHVAFNEPPTSRFYQVSTEQFKKSKTRILTLAPETMVMNSSRSGGSRFADFPPMAIAIGMKDILESKRIRLFCDGGEWQRTAIREAVAGDPSIDYPVSLLRGHPDYEICLDEETIQPALFHI